MTVRNEARYPLLCGHCGRSRAQARGHCQPDRHGQPKACDWIVCPCGAVTNPHGEHWHIKHGGTEDTCKSLPRSAK